MLFRSPIVENILWRRAKDQRDFRISDTIPSQHEVLACKDFIQDNLVIGSLDKNPGAVDIFCPKILWNLMKSTFWDNKVNYRSTSFSAKTIMTFFKRAFQKHNSLEFDCKIQVSRICPISLFDKES